MTHDAEEGPRRPPRLAGGRPPSSRETAELLTALVERGFYVIGALPSDDLPGPGDPPHDHPEPEPPPPSDPPA